MKRGIKRPRNVDPNDTRSPMRRFLEGVDANGYVYPDYDAQWRTLWKAQQLGYVTGNRVTEKGLAFLKSAAK